tara:strand:- start:5670 stop:5882 length:213 start_codon:yes stop_codon:yes gene_type:complete
MSEEPDVGDYEEYVLSGIEDQASEEVAQKYQEIERVEPEICRNCHHYTKKQCRESDCRCGCFLLRGRNHE